MKNLKSISWRSKKLFPLLCLLSIPVISHAGNIGNASILDWPVYGKDAKHSSFINVAGQGTNKVLAQFVLDSNAAAELADQGDILVHYQSPLLIGDDDVYSEIKGGTYTNGDPDTGVINWDTQTWGEKKLSWNDGKLKEKWTYISGWKPTPYSSNPAFTLGSGPVGPTWEPVFQAAYANGAVYVPESGGRIVKLNSNSGNVMQTFNPFGHTINSAIFVTSPLTADKDGNIYYTAMQLAIPAGTTDPNVRSSDAWDNDVVDSWLVKISPNGAINKATFSSLTPGAISANAQCEGSFTSTQLAANGSLPIIGQKPATVTCGHQRPGMNVIPAIADDGTIYVASRTHFSSRHSYLVAVNPNLSPKWIASLRDRFNDGCNVLLPPNGTIGGCTNGAKKGVDPATNNTPAGRLIDDSSASPTIAPDGSIFFGVITRYNFDQGHMMHFDKNGHYLNSYLFGWDATPGIYPHNNTYSVIFKENHYGGVGSYCNNETICPSDRTGTYPNNPEESFVSQFNPNLVREWAYKNTNTNSCVRDSQGNVTCVSDHPNSFEWCVNSVVTDKLGKVYAASEDGNIYTINQGGTLFQNTFLSLSLGAAYTPTALDSKGRLFAQNYGLVFVLGK
ncbi:MAG: hypothetical protein JSR17_08495 [Proteobacteria bacterium]|nr:hypothetical protein [Pseudomonadota bacterium]